MIKIISKLKEGDEEERLEAVTELKKCGNEGLSAIASVMGDESWRVRKAVVEAFLENKDNEVIYPFLIKALYDDENAGRRNTSCEIFVKIGVPAVKFIIPELKSIDKDVRKFVVDIMGGICDRTLIPHIKEAIQDSDENVSSAAVEALGKIGSEEAYSYLLECLHVQKPFLQFTALEAIGELKQKIPESTVNFLLKSPLLKRALFDALGKIGDVNYLPYLFEGSFEKVKNVRESAILAIKRVCSKSSEEEITPFLDILYNLEREKGFLPDILSGLKSLSMDILKATIFFLGLLKKTTAACEIAPYLADDETKNEAYKSLIAIGRGGSEELFRCYKDCEDAVKSLLVLIFAKIGEVRAEDILLKGLKSNSGHLRANSGKALASLGFIQYIDEITNLLNDQYSDVQQAAVESVKLLAKQNKKEVTSHLRTLLTKPADVRKKANIVKVIGEIATDDDIEIIEAALKDQDPLVRKAALKAVKNIGSPSLIESSVYLLSDENPQVRGEVVKLLGAIKKKDYIPQLKISLYDEDVWVRIASIKALAEIGGDECFEIISSSLSDGEPIIVINALEILGQNRYEKVIPYLINLLNNPDSEILSSALNLLFEYEYRFTPKDIELVYPYLNSDLRLMLLSRLAFILDSSYLDCLKKISEIENDPLVKERVDYFISSFNQREK